MAKRYLFLATSIFLVSGCGLERLARETKNEVVVSNQTQRDLLEYMRKTHMLTEQLRDLTTKMEQGVHLQILTVSLEQMFNPTNTAVLAPPTRMMPYAESFAKEATEDELIRIIHVLWQDAYSKPKYLKESGQTSLVGLSTIAALTPEAKARNILHLQIEERGRFEDAAYVFALARYAFTRDYLFHSTIEGMKYLNKGALRDCTQHFSVMKYLSELPYADRFELNLPSLDIEEKLDPKELRLLARKAKRRFENGLDQQTLGTVEVQELLKTFES